MYIYIMSSQTSQSKQENKRDLSSPMETEQNTPAPTNRKNADAEAYYKFYYEAFKSFSNDTKENIIEKSNKGVIKLWKIPKKTTITNLHKIIYIPDYFAYYKPYSIDEADAILSSVKVTLVPNYKKPYRDMIKKEDEVKHNDILTKLNTEYDADTARINKENFKKRKKIEDKLNNAKTDKEKKKMNTAYKEELNKQLYDASERYFEYIINIGRLKDLIKEDDIKYYMNMKYLQGKKVYKNTTTFLREGKPYTLHTPRDTFVDITTDYYKYLNNLHNEIYKEICDKTPEICKPKSNPENEEDNEEDEKDKTKYIPKPFDINEAIAHIGLKNKNVNNIGNGNGVNNENLGIVQGTTEIAGRVADFSIINAIFGSGGKRKSRKSRKSNKRRTHKR